MRVVLPHNLELENILIEHKPMFPHTIGCFKYILGLIVERSAFDHHLLDAHEAFPFVPLSSKRLNQVVTHYQKYIRYLLEVGILECDFVCEPGAKCYGYRYTSNYRTKAVVETIREDKDYWLLVKHKRQKKQIKQTALAMYPILVHWFDGLVLHTEVALAHIEATYQTELMASGKSATKQANAINRYNAHLAMIERFNDPESSFAVDESGHRFHSKLTNLWSQLRQFVTYNGHPLVSIDLRSSQLYLAILLLDGAFYEQSSAEAIGLTMYDLPIDVQDKVWAVPTLVQLESQHKAQRDQLSLEDIKMVNREEGIKRVRGSLMLEIPTKLVEYWEGRKRYIDCIQTGRLYETLAQYWSNITGKPVPDREQFKKQIISALYSDNYDNRYYFVIIRELFKALFPRVYDVFRELKTRSNRDLAVVLQGIESEVFLNRIASRISRQYPELPIFTIHDCVVTLEGYEDCVADIMREELTKATGISPRLKIEAW
ncbi:hypothetical protein GCM10027592_46780 [Spirosoma flavus]